ncbi:MAG: hypothetical protein AAGC55_26475, partial [Myxococcota bacterium]
MISRLSMVLAVACLAAAACTSGAQAPEAPGTGAAPPTPPVAEAIPHRTVVHGQERVDNYHWIRERNSPRVLAYLEAENRYTNAMMKHTGALQEQLFQEMKGRIKETDLSVPVKVDDFWYYSRTEAGQQYWVFCRKRGSLDADEEVLLDVNQQAAGKEFFSIGTVAVSPDHNLLAFTADESGSEEYTLRVKDLRSGALLLDTVHKITASVEWGNDNSTLYYMVQDASHRAHQVLRHELGASGADQVMYREDDERFHLRLSKSKSEKFILITAESQTTTEVAVIDADQRPEAARVFRPRKPGVEYR